MKKSKFQINVWDLLLSAGKRDEIIFKNETLEEIKNLSKDGISGEVVIQSFDQNSLFVTIEDINCTITEPCDKCGTIYDRKIQIDEYSAKFQAKLDKDEESDEPVFLIDKNENIDIKDMIMQSVLLEDPFIKKCEICTKEDSYNDDEDEIEYFEWNWNVNFR